MYKIFRLFSGVFPESIGPDFWLVLVCPTSGSYDNNEVPAWIAHGLLYLVVLYCFKYLPIHFLTVFVKYSCDKNEWVWARRRQAEEVDLAELS